MQDIGGCRAVLPSVSDVFELKKIYERKSLIHDLVGEDDYISCPKQTGYRSVHLKYRFTGRNNTQPWDKLKIEIQIRTFLQHRWATAVEAVGIFTNQALKSNAGNKDWLRFFALMGSVYALDEKCKPVPGTYEDKKDIVSEIRELNSVHDYVTILGGYSTLIPHIERRQGRYFLIKLDPVRRRITIDGFGRNQSREVNSRYTAMEDEFRGTQIQIVLVSADSIKSLKRAYPNYFTDISDFARDFETVLR